MSNEQGKLDCGHMPGPGMPANVNGRTVQGWTHVVRDGKTLCHECDGRRTLDCGHQPSPHDVCTTGTAHTSDGREICWECADHEHRESLKDRRPTGGYLSSDGKTVTTWSGGHLATVTWSRPCRLTRVSWVHGKSYVSVNARDVHGNYWTGRGSPGIAIRLRPMKAPR